MHPPITCADDPPDADPQAAPIVPGAKRAAALSNTRDCETPISRTPPIAVVDRETGRVTKSTLGFVTVLGSGSLVGGRLVTYDKR